MQGPNALPIMEKVTGKAVPDVKFFNMTEFTIAGHHVRALRHGMVGQPGFELFGPWEEGEAVKAAIVEAGQEFGLKLSGSRTYSSNTLESGWIPSPMPAIYSGEQMKAYRQWLPANGYEGDGVARRQLLLRQHRGLLPDAVGPRLRHGGEVRSRLHRPRGAREDRREPAPQEGHARAEQRRRPRRAWRRVSNGTAAKHFEFPSSVYSTLPYDKVMKDGKTIGVSTWCGYSSNEGQDADAGDRRHRAQPSRARR